MLRQRHGKITSPSEGLSEAASGSLPDPRAMIDSEKKPEIDGVSRKTQWVFLAVASGACAAFNGVLAKLTTTSLTTSLSTYLAAILRLPPTLVEIPTRATFFALNLVFNGVMWTLFTRALARGTSSTQVTIINTSANFMLTALLGFAIFAEELPAQWWLGASLLVVGNVIIGRREEDEKGAGVRREEEEQERLVFNSAKTERGLERQQADSGSSRVVSDVSAG